MNNFSTINILFKLIVVYIFEQNNYLKKRNILTAKTVIMHITVHLFRQL